MLRNSLIVGCLVAATTAPAMAQNCDDGKAATAPMSRFKDVGDGVLKDTSTKKLWLRCALGMSWSGGSCEGSTLTYSWNGAQGAIDEMNQQRVGGHSTWRLPTREELEGIVEQRCYKPAIDLDAFPFSPESGFWTATDAEGFNPRAWVVHFLNGGTYVGNKNQTWRVRPIADN